LPAWCSSRYREPAVALPMIVTALAEVYALLGFAALLSYPPSSWL